MHTSKVVITFMSDESRRFYAARGDYVIQENMQ